MIDEEAPKSEASLAWQRLLDSRPARVGLALCLAFLVVALTADWIAPYSYKKLDLSHLLAAPSLGSDGGRFPHLLGTDYLGRDQLSRLLYGAQISMTVGFISVLLALSVGTVLGALAGFAGGWIETVIMRSMDLMLAFPSILLAIAIVSIMGNSLGHAMMAVGIVGIPIFARLTRASVLTIKELDYVTAAISIGASPLRVMVVHILPNCLNPLIVQSTLSLGTSVLEAAGLSFLGLGAKPPLPEWGTMLADTYSYYDKAPWLVLGPGLCIFSMVLGFNLLGDGLRDALDPKQK